MRVKLTDICTPKQWKTLPTSQLLEEGYPVYGANGIIGYYSEYNHENSVVAITCRGATCGTINITVPKAYITGNAMCLDDVQADILQEYLYYCLLQYDFNKVISGSAQPQITRQGLEKVEIELYSLEEQQKIIEVLGKLKIIIDSRKLELHKLDDLIKARFVEMFGDAVNNDRGWETASVESVCKEIFGGGTPSKSHPEYYENGDIPWVSSKDMKTDVLYDSQIKINQLGVDNSTARMVPVNSVIMVIRSGILKHTLPVAISAVPLTVNQDLKVFVPGDRIVTRFMAMQFKMHESDILSGVRAVTADNIEFNSLKQRQLIIPPLELQNEFVGFAKQVDKSKVVA